MDLQRDALAFIFHRRVDLADQAALLIIRLAQRAHRRLQRRIQSLGQLPRQQHARQQAETADHQLHIKPARLFQQ